MTSANLTPVDMLNQQFRRKMNGYAVAEVDEFVRRSAASLETALAENAKQREQIAALQREMEQYRQLETLMRDALVLAQKAADETRAAARAQAEAMLQEAQGRVNEVLNQLDRLRQERRRLARDLHARLVAQMTWLEEELAAEPPMAQIVSEARQSGAMATSAERNGQTATVALASDAPSEPAPATASEAA